MTLRVLVGVIGQGSDTMGKGSAWRALQASLQPLISARQLEVQRIERATESELAARLHEGWDVLHLLSLDPGAHRARYRTLAVEARDGSARALTLAYFGKSLHECGHSGLVVLQERVADADSAATAGALVVAGAKAVACATGDSTGALPFYAALAARRSLADCAVAAGTWLTGWAGDLVTVPPGAAPLSAAARPEVTVVVDPAAVGPPQALEREPVIAAPRRLAAKRQSQQFDVFMCHNSADKPAVQVIARLLMERAILPWVDEWELRPGLAWQPALEQAIGGIRSAAVFVGPDGMGPWQRQEMDVFLNEFVRRRLPVIPVLLGNVPHEPRLPLFLQGMTWVDFRASQPDPLRRLIWGITGENLACW